MDYFENLFRAISGWLVLLLSFFRLMSVFSPMKWNSFSCRFFLTLMAVLISVLSVLHSFPLFTKEVRKISVGENMEIRVCHHRDVLGVEFFEFETIFKALIFPLLPCLFILPINILLLFFNCQGQVTVYSSLTKAQRKSKFHRMNLYANVCESVKSSCLCVHACA